MFWADRFVEEVIENRPPPFKVYDWWTPSGWAHAGHIRTFLYHQAIYQGLRLRNQAVTYYYGFDDMDPLDGLPRDVPESFRQFLGQPLFRVPSPEAGVASFADYYCAKYLEAMEDLDVHPEVPRTSQLYGEGVFNAAITRALDEAEKIRAIYADLGTPRPPDWHPLQVICEECRKIGTTYVYGWDGERVSYRCEANLVPWATGCGYEGCLSPYNGQAKLPWKVEWPAKWFIFRPDFEGAGKDHFTKGGSRDYGRRIVREVFEGQEPIGYPHEFFLLGGKKMASSKGLGITANEAAHILPSYLMRYFVYRVPPKRQIEFNPEGEIIPKIYDDFDRSLAAHHEDPGSDLGRVVVYARQSGEPLPRYTLRFSKVTFLVQMPHVTVNQVAAEEKGSALTPAEEKELIVRVEFARRWLDRYADPSAKFILLPEPPSVALTQEQRIYLGQVRERLTQADWVGEAIHSLLHEAKTALGLPSSEAFSALYQIFLGRESGPQAGWFLAALDRSFVLARLGAATEEKGHA